MELTGLPLGAVLGTLAGVGAALVALYLLKQRRQRLTVPHVALWEQLLSARQSSAWWKRLRQLWSLLLALLIAALIVLALGDPRRELEQRGQHTVVLIDASASMGATDVPGGRLEAAKQQARRLVNQLSPADHALIAQLDTSVKPLTPLTDDRADLLAAVDKVAVSDLPGDLKAGITFAADVLRGRTKPRVVVISDGRLQDAPDPSSPVTDLPLTYLRVGKDADSENVAVTAFAVRRYPLDKSRSEVLISLRNFGKSDAKIDLQLLAEGDLLHQQALSIPGQGELSRVLANLPGADRTLEARIQRTDGGTDLLPSDDVAYARLPERRRMRVLTVSEGNRYLEAALLLDEYLQVDEVTPSQHTGAAGYDVVIYDGWLPDSPPETRAVYLNPTPRSGAFTPVQTAGTLERPFMDRLDRKHPLLRWVALRDVNIGRAHKVNAEPGDTVVAATASREPLILTGSRQTHPFVMLTFDPRESDLPLRIAWPVLLLNALQHLGGETGDYLSSFPTGRAFRLPVPDGATSAEVETPTGTRRPVPVRDGAAVFSADRAGFYKLFSAGTELVFAVNGSATQEGALKPADTLREQQPGQVAKLQGDLKPGQALWPWLLCAALILLATEWFTYHRRWTV